MTSAFSELLTRPMSAQMLWLVWRDEQLKRRPREYFIENAECPLATCQAIKGEKCRSRRGRATYHESLREPNNNRRISSLRQAIC